MSTASERKPVATGTGLAKVQPPHVAVVMRQTQWRSFLSDALSARGVSVTSLATVEDLVGSAPLDVLVLDCDTTSRRAELLVTRARERFPLVELVAVATGVDALHACLVAGADQIVLRTDTADESLVVGIAAAAEHAWRGRRNGTPGAGSAVVFPPSLMNLNYRDAKLLAMATFERCYFKSVLQRSDFNWTRAAKHAGLDRSNLRRAARRVGIGSKSK